MCRLALDDEAHVCTNLCRCTVHVNEQNSIALRFATAATPGNRWPFLAGRGWKNELLTQSTGPSDMMNAVYVFVCFTDVIPYGRLGIGRSRQCFSFAFVNSNWAVNEQKFVCKFWLDWELVCRRFDFRSQRSSREVRCCRWFTLHEWFDVRFSTWFMKFNYTSMLW